MPLLLGGFTWGWWDDFPWPSFDFDHECGLTVIYRVENGTFEDRTNERIVEGAYTDGKGNYLGEKPTDLVPAEGYEGGHWEFERTVDKGSCWLFH